MKIQLEHLGEEPLSWKEELEVSRDELGHPEVSGLTPIQTQGRIEPVQPGFLFSLSLAYSQTISCDRCLDEAAQEVTVDFRLLMLLGGEGEVEEEQELEADDLHMIRLESPELETKPYVLEQVLLNVPMKPLCRADCKGLCSSCGANLNLSPCTCSSHGDPRWAALAGLKKHLEE